MLLMCVRTCVYVKAIKLPNTRTRSHPQLYVSLCVLLIHKMFQSAKDEQ